MLCICVLCVFSEEKKFECTFNEVRHISFNGVLISMDPADQKEIRDIYIYLQVQFSKSLKKVINLFRRQH